MARLSAPRRHYLGAALLGLVLTALGPWGCAYHHYVGPLQPAADQGHSVTAENEGLTFRSQGLEIHLRPMLDAELDRRFAAHSQSGPRSTNPYTFADVEFWPPGPSTSRFTVVYIEVANEGYPKIKIDPAKMALRANTGEEYWSLSLQQLDTYYRAYTEGFQGDAFSRYRERMDLLNRTTFRNEEIFMGQQKSGYVIFPALSHNVQRLSLSLHDVVLRFDYRSEPAETVDVVYQFERQTGRIYDNGRVILEELPPPR